MSEKTIPFTIPDAPTDKYRVKFYRLSMSRLWCYINEIECIYYVNTPWDEYAPDRKGGAALVDDWICLKDSHPEGRICEWKGILNIQPDNIFATRKDAIREAIRRYNVYIEKTMKSVQDIKRRRDELVEKI